MWCEWNHIKILCSRITWVEVKRFEVQTYSLIVMTICRAWRWSWRAWDVSLKSLTSVSEEPLCYFKNLITKFIINDLINDIISNKEELLFCTVIWFSNFFAHNVSWDTRTLYTSTARDYFSIILNLFLGYESIVELDLGNVVRELITFLTKHWL